MNSTQKHTRMTETVFTKPRPFLARLFSGLFGGFPAFIGLSVVDYGLGPTWLIG